MKVFVLWRGEPKTKLDEVLLSEGNTELPLALVEALMAHTDLDADLHFLDGKLYGRRRLKEVSFGLE